jgi:hypothetical protein
VLTSAPPIDGLEPPAEMTTGGELSTHGSAAVVGVPATLTPPASDQAIRVPSCESEASRAGPSVAR